MKPEILSYNASAVDVLRQRSQSNKGLVFDRYLSLWEFETSGRFKEKVNDKYAVLKDFTQTFKDIDEASLAVVHARQERILAHAGNIAGKSYTLSSVWRIACGLGYDHPIENGFTLDHNSGLPYLPGSSIKGLCRYVFEQYIAAAQNSKNFNAEKMFDLFGSDETDSPTSVQNTGDIVFFDAFPEKVPAVEVDIINNHHGQYYEQLNTYDENEGSLPSPMETESPNPVFFLAIGTHTPFVFRLFSRSRNTENLKIIDSVILDGLTIFGIGAKTSVGYGRFMGPDIKWLDEAIVSLCKQHNEPDSMNILRGKSLAKEWTKISDSDLKDAVKKTIADRWKDASVTINKSVKQIYDQG